jgi:hypothetical protein
MLYALPNGERIVLENIHSVSQVRDKGGTGSYIEPNKMGFTIHLAKREIVEVVEPYHFSDWADVKNRLNKLRNELIEKWKEAKEGKTD